MLPCWCRILCEKGNSEATYSMQPDTVEPCAAAAAASTDSSGKLLLHQLFLHISFQQEGKTACTFLSSHLDLV